ncbi:hypothetical protein ACFCYH_37515, partial [Streptomyces sp. NPDC056400]|uniref:hypothetical protein n=1 Tax=Streptomyces sp. NPDC056400 TaxID=3345808 RepID=UPI0035DEFB9A
TPVPASYGPQILGGRLAIWSDLAGAQTQAQVAAGIQAPLAALARKVRPDTFAACPKTPLNSPRT